MKILAPQEGNLGYQPHLLGRMAPVKVKLALLGRIAPVKVKLALLGRMAPVKNEIGPTQARLL